MSGLDTRHACILCWHLVLGWYCQICGRSPADGGDEHGLTQCAPFADAAKVLTGRWGRPCGSGVRRDRRSSSHARIRGGRGSALSAQMERATATRLVWTAGTGL